MVVGLYGDRSVTWSIQLRVWLSAPVDADDVASRWETLTEINPGLGRVGVVTRFGDDDAHDVCVDFANEPYGDQDPLVRVGLHDDGSVLVVAAHHGAMDGLGMLGAAGVLADLSLETGARGVASDADDSSFLLGSARRLWEALVRPPVRVRARSAKQGEGDLLASRDVVADRAASAELIWAAARAVRTWNQQPGGGRRGRQLVIAMGLSRRPGRPMPAPDRDTAYVRLQADDVVTVGDARAVARDTPPEPEFPLSEGFGVAQLVTKLLGSRLGSTLLVSNLGLVDSPGVQRLELWPAPAGPAGVAIGLASTSSRTTLTVRLRRPWFVEGDEDRFLELLSAQLESAGRASQ